MNRGVCKALLATMEATLKEHRKHQQELRVSTDNLTESLLKRFNQKGVSRMNECNAEDSGSTVTGRNNKVGLLCPECGFDFIVIVHNLTCNLVQNIAGFFNVASCPQCHTKLFYSQLTGKQHVLIPYDPPAEFAGNKADVKAGYIPNVNVVHSDDEVAQVAYKVASYITGHEVKPQLNEADGVFFGLSPVMEPDDHCDSDLGDPDKWQIGFKSGHKIEVDYTELWRFAFEYINIDHVAYVLPVYEEGES